MIFIIIIVYKNSIDKTNNFIFTFTKFINLYIREKNLVFNFFA